MLWFLIGIMLTAAVLIVAVPLYRAENRLSMTSVYSIVVVTALSAAIYSQIGTPGSEAQLSQTPDVDEMVASLAARLQENPEDLSGWKMLGRSYFRLRNFPGAVTAYQNAVELESGENGETLADLGEALLYSDQRALFGDAGELFESALVITPNNPKALFYSGMAAVERGDEELGVSRWEAFLATSPPANVREIIRQQIAALRGTDIPSPVEAPAAAVVNVTVTMGDAAIAASSPDAIVFIIARDPARPSPPIAAVRRQVSELPALVPLGDSDAMMPGRVPSGFEQLEIVARISMSGQPVAASGDWFGQQVIDTAASDTVQITIDRQVP